MSKPASELKELTRKHAGDADRSIAALVSRVLLSRWRKAPCCCRKRYKKSPSFLSIHTGVCADVLPPGTQCHHIIVEDWQTMESPLGTLFVSIPTLLDPTLSPDGTHIVHIFSPDWIDNWKVSRSLSCLLQSSCDLWILWPSCLRYD